jgi:hypothetical protein
MHLFSLFIFFLFNYIYILFIYLFIIILKNYASIPYNQVAPVRKEKVICQVLEGVREIGIML